MFPTFTNLSNRHEKEKSLIHQLQLQKQIDKLSSEMYSKADWNGQSLLSLDGHVNRTTLSTQTETQPMALPINTHLFTPSAERQLFTDFSRLENRGDSSPMSVVSLPTTKAEKKRTNGNTDFINELRSRIISPNLRPSKRGQTPSSDVSMAESENYGTPDERLRYRMPSMDVSMSPMSSLDLNDLHHQSVSREGSPSHQSVATTATTYLGTIANAEQDDVPPKERDLSAKDSAEFIKALLDPTKLSGALYERILKEPVFENKTTKEIQQLPFKPISKSTGKPLLKAEWDPKQKNWVNSGGFKANVDEIKTFISLWKTIKNNFHGNPNHLLRERNTLIKPMGDHIIQIADSPPVSQGKGLKGGSVKRGRFNHLTYKKIGARSVHLPNLQKGYLSVRHMNGTMSGRKTKIDEGLQQLIKEFVYDDHINQNLYDKLDVDDQHIFSELLKATRIQHTLKNGWLSPKENLKARYDKLVGELHLGNDSVIPELKKTLIDMYSEQMISSKDFKNLLENLL